MKETEALPGLASVVDDQRAEVIDCALPRRRPQWDYSTERGRRSLCEYHKVHLKEMKQAFWKPTNLSRVSKVIDVKPGLDELPTVFLEHLLDSYWLYASKVPVDLANLKVISLAFVTHSAPNICRKIQKMNGFAGKKKSGQNY